MNIGIESMVTNLGMSLTNIILLVVTIASLIFMAVKFEVGAMMLFITTGVVFVIEYANGYDYVSALVVFFISLVMMAISLLAQKDSGGMLG